VSQGTGGGQPGGTGGDPGTGGEQPRDGGAMPMPDCRVPADCVLLVTDPPGCAEGACESGRCVYRALDRDGDGLRATVCATPGCLVETGADCDDTNPDVHPGATEICNGIDDDCDFALDEDIAADPERPCEVGVGECMRTGNATCVAGAVVWMRRFSGPTAGGGLSAV
jgi:hypothetical protein